MKKKIINTLIFIASIVTFICLLGEMPNASALEFLVAKAAMLATLFMLVKVTKRTAPELWEDEGC